LQFVASYLKMFQVGKDLDDLARILRAETLHQRLADFLA
jgi:hypothetical protein